MYIHQLKDWPSFTWDTEAILIRLGEVRYRQGHIWGLMSSAGFKLKENALLDTLTLDVTKSSEIEGEKLNTDQVRSSIARRLGIEIAGAVSADRNVDGVVEMMLDATQKYTDVLTADRLFDWHAALFPTGRSGMHKITVAAWRTPEAGPMQVVSGAMGKEKVHFEAPEAERLPAEMEAFLNWLNAESNTDAVLKAAIAHLWFVTIHPFDDGNGRITRAITDMLLARADGTSQRFYSMSAQIMREKADYYHILEATQKGSLDITPWLKWFLDCLYFAMDHTEETLSAVAKRTQFWDKHRETVLNSRQQQMVTALLDEFYGKLTSTKWAKMTKSSPDTALRDIQDLIEKGILEKEAGGGRNTAYSIVA
ncbi:Fic family protein [Mucilaginibacter sp. JRF]|uniref:Fic family protein n=1 Tax=Mucilaginibacter sp. JRF TaxID=2780088 RepID=UPI001881BAFA|nr:Fic family protein [Mucilaginibacter sp. JRF]MBE9585702.1 Fic family protein [Mucilaginibacter sp. JRF]